MILRIFDKETKIWLRDDNKFNPETEIAITKEIPGSMYAKEGICPVWDGEKWIQNLEPPTLDMTSQEPSLEERNRADIDYIAIMTGVEL